MKLKYEIGDRVQLVPDNEFMFQSDGKAGRIIGMTALYRKHYPDLNTDDFYYDIKWDGKSTEDVYRPCDIMNESEMNPSVESIFQRYGYISMNDKFENIDDDCDGIIKTINPQEWTFYQGCVYLAKDGQGGLKLIDNDKWAKRTALPDRWQVKCVNNMSDMPELSEWRLNAGSYPCEWYGDGYIDCEGWFDSRQNVSTALITYDEFIKWVYDPWKKLSTVTKETYKALPFPESNPSAFKIVANCDIYRKDITTAGKMPDVIPKGTVSWSDRIDHFNDVLNGVDYVLPEDNRWRANIPSKYFNIHPDYINHFKAVKSPSDVEKFKIGDWVIGWHVGHEYRKTAWQIGDIRGEYAYPKDNPTFNTDISSLKKASPFKDYKIGDTVRVIGESHGWGILNIGDIGTVSGIYDDYMLVNFLKHRGWKGTFNCFELVESCKTEAIVCDDDCVAIVSKEIKPTSPINHPESINLLVRKSKKINRLSI